jgi:acetyl esterase/lipase
MNEFPKIRGVSFGRRHIAMAGLWLFLLIATSVAIAAAARGAAPGPTRFLDPVFGNLDTQRDIVYGQAVDGKTHAPVTLKLDLYQPAGDSAQARPMIIWAHGGGFTGGDKEAPPHAEVAQDFAHRGWVSASINYRLDGNAGDATHDMQAAVRWSRAHAAQYRVNPNEIVVGGSSAGAIMALGAVFDPQDAGDSGNPGYPSNVAAGLIVAGSEDDPSQIHAGAPPIAMFQALDDTVNPAAATEGTCQETKAMGNVCQVFLYERGGHPPGFLIDNRAQIIEQSSQFLCGLNLCTYGPGSLHQLASLRIHLRCPRGVRHTCRIKAVAMTRRRHGKAESMPARAKIKPGKSKLVVLHVKQRFAGRLAKARKALIHEMIRAGGHQWSMYRRVSLLRH